MNQPPIIGDLAAQIVAKIETKISQTIPFLPRGFTHVLAVVLAGATVLIYKYTGWLGLQVFAEYAAWEEVTINGRTIRPLVEIGKEIGVGVPLPATQAELTITVTVETESTVVAKGTAWTHDATGLTFISSAEVTVTGSTYPVPIIAAADANGGVGLGTVGNLAIGEVVTLSRPLAGIAREAVVASVDQPATDGETEDAYRIKVARRYRRRPQGGAYADYQIWASIPGVLNAYPYTGDVPGQVIVYIEANQDAQIDDDGTPSAGLLEDVATAIRFDENGTANRCPPQVFEDGGLSVVSIERLPFTIVLLGQTPDDAEVTDAINVAVDEYLRTLEHFQVGLSQLPRQDRITFGSVAGIAHSVAQSYGATLTNIELKRLGIDVLHFTLSQGQRAKLDY